MKKLIHFDWAMKKLLREKANFDILEGFLEELTDEKMQIIQILESESKKEMENNKFNCVDLLVENHRNELIIIEIQNSKEFDYFHRILYGTSKVITEHIKSGEKYHNVKKVISITIAYFDLGQGEDYVYHGTTNFVGIHRHDLLELTQKQKEAYLKFQIKDIFPEYWIIKVGQFSDIVKDKLDEWIYFFNNSEVEDHFTAKGISEAKVKLSEMQMNVSQRR